MIIVVPLIPLLCTWIKKKFKLVPVVRTGRSIVKMSGKSRSYRGKEINKGARVIGYSRMLSLGDETCNETAKLFM